MKKRYYQTGDDRMDESLGERRGAEKTKMQSYKDRRDESRGMSKRMMPETMTIREDMHATANLPQHVIIQKVPGHAYSTGGYLDDGINGIDYMERQNEEKLRDQMDEPFGK